MGHFYPDYRTLLFTFAGGITFGSSTRLADRLWYSTFNTPWRGVSSSYGWLYLSADHLRCLAWLCRLTTWWLFGILTVGCSGYPAPPDYMFSLQTFGYCAFPVARIYLVFPRWSGLMGWNGVGWPLRVLPVDLPGLGAAGGPLRWVYAAFMLTPVGASPPICGQIVWWTGDSCFYDDDVLLPWTLCSPV
jgi:hypothetical protein